MKSFDHTNIPDDGVRTEFAHIALRAENIARSLQNAYGRARAPIGFRYISDYEFNAYARPDGEGYLIELNAAVPLFSIILFYKLLSDPEWLSALSSDGAKASDFALPLVVDPADFGRRAEWRIELNEIRAFAAGTLADLCSTFVLCHEFGHILAGHVEGYRHYLGKERIAELVSYSRSSADELKIRQAWEFDADAIAATILANFVEELAASAQPRTQAVFAHPAGFHRENVLAIAVGALAAFFTYIQGAAVRFAKRSSHPHPFVRSLYLKTMLFQAVGDYGPLNSALFHELLDRRMDESLIVLERIGLVRPALYTQSFIRRADTQIDQLGSLSRDHADKCAAWRWLPPVGAPADQTTINS